MDSEDGIDVSDKLAGKKYVRLSLDFVQAVVDTVEVLILGVLPHDSDLQTLNLALLHIETTSGIVFDDALRIDEEPDSLPKEVRRPVSLVNLPYPLEIVLGSVPSNKNDSFVVPCVGIYPSHELIPNGSQITGPHYAGVGDAQLMDAIELIVPNRSLPRVHVYVEGVWFPPNIYCGVGPDFCAFQIQYDQLARHLKDAAISPSPVSMSKEIYTTLFASMGRCVKDRHLGVDRGKASLLLGTIATGSGCTLGLAAGCAAG